MRRPIFINIMAILWLLTAGSIVLSFWRSYTLGYFGVAVLFPDSPLSVPQQWLVTGISAILQIVIAAGLLGARRWARPSIILFSLVAWGWFMATGPSRAWTIYVLLQVAYGVVFWLVCVVLLYRGEVARYFVPGSFQRPRYVFSRFMGTTFYVLAAVLFHFFVMAIFLGVDVPDPRTGEAHGLSGALWVALFLLFVAEGFYRAPGAAARLGALSAAFSLFLIQIVVIPALTVQAVQMTPLLRQLQTWTLMFTVVAVLLLGWVYLGGRRRQRQSGNAQG